MKKDLFDLDNYDETEKELQSLIFRKDEFHPAIYEIIRKSIHPRYKSFIYHFKDKRIENAFQKTMPQSRKTNIQDQTRNFKTNYSRNLI